MNKEALLNVARACRESKHPEKFTMEYYAHSCGTPACALGHYAARQDLQSDFYLDEEGVFRTSMKGLESYATLTAFLRHFALTVQQEEQLFGMWGCNKARTPVEAAEYIERFVAEHS
jgi:hypothetical protein